MKKINLILLTALTLGTLFSATETFAFIPNPSQLARFQPSLMTRLPPFKSSGSLQFKETSMPYILNWVDPEKYVLEIKGIPPRLYVEGQGPDTWKLIRDKTYCMLIAGSLKMNCPGAQTWALLELSGLPESGARGLYVADLIDVEDIPLGQTSSETYLDTRSKNRVSISIASNGTAPAALLSLQGLKTEEDEDGQPFPEILFDQSFLKAVQLRLRRKGEVFSVKAKADLELRRKRTRYTYVFSEELTIESNLKLSSTIRRSVPTFSGALKKMPKQVRSLHQIDLIQEKLSVEGQFLLDSVFLTH